MGVNFYKWAIAQKAFWRDCIVLAFVGCRDTS